MKRVELELIDHRGDSWSSSTLNAYPIKSDLGKGRMQDDERIPRDKDGKPKGKNGNRYKRDFGVPEDAAQKNFTDPDSRIKHVLGFRSFSMRGLSKAKAEWKLICAALNLCRMAHLMAASGANAHPMPSPPCACPLKD